MSSQDGSLTGLLWCTWFMYVLGVAISELQWVSFFEKFWGIRSWTAGLACETSLEDKPVFNIRFPSELMQILILERSELLLSMTTQVQTAALIHLPSKLDNRVIRNAQVDPWDAKHITPTAIRYHQLYLLLMTRVNYPCQMVIFLPISLFFGMRIQSIQVTVQLEANSTLAKFPVEVFPL